MSCYQWEKFATTHAIVSPDFPISNYSKKNYSHSTPKGLPVCAMASKSYDWDLRSIAKISQNFNPVWTPFTAHAALVNLILVIRLNISCFQAGSKKVVVFMNAEIVKEGFDCERIGKPTPWVDAPEDKTARVNNTPHSDISSTVSSASSLTPASPHPQAGR